MAVYKRYTNKAKTRIKWGYIIDLPPIEFLPNGKPKRNQESLCQWDSEKAAKKAEFERLKEIESGKIVINGNSTFLDIAKMFLTYAQKAYEKGTYTNYKGYNENHLVYFHNVKIKNLTSLYIENWIIDMIKNNNRPSLINNCRKFAIAAFNYAKKHKRIGYNPFEDMEKLEEPEVLRKRFSTKQLKEILEICKNKMPEFYCLFVLASLTGMRLGEYTALTKDDIDFENGIIFVRRQYTKRELKDRNKTKKSTRKVHISSGVMEVIKWHIRTYKIFGGFLFEGKNNLPVSENWVNDKFDELLIKGGYKKDFCRVHDLRGQFVDLMHSLGVPTVYISREVGHARTSTTNDIYSEILGEVNTKATSLIDEKIFG